MQSSKAQSDSRPEVGPKVSKYIKEPQIAKLNEQGKLKKWVLIFVKDKCMVNKEI